MFNNYLYIQSWKDINYFTIPRFPDFQECVMLTSVSHSTVQQWHIVIINPIKLANNMLSKNLLIFAHEITSVNLTTAKLNKKPSAFQLGTASA